MKYRNFIDSAKPSENQSIQPKVTLENYSSKTACSISTSRPKRLLGNKENQRNSESLGANVRVGGVVMNLVDGILASACCHSVAKTTATFLLIPGLRGPSSP